MATRRQPLIPGWLIPGVSAATLVVAVALAAFLALWWNAPQGDWVSVWQDSYLWHVVRFLLLAGVFFGAALCRTRNILARALSQALSWATDATGLCAMTLILPVLVAVFGILSVYGRQGWLASLWQSLGLEWTFRPTACKAFCWPMCFLICRWLAVYYPGTGKHSRRNNVSLPPSLGCAAVTSSASSNGRGYGDKSRRLPH